MDLAECRRQAKWRCRGRESDRAVALALLKNPIERLTARGP